MGDVISSRDHDGATLGRHLKELVDSVNRQFETRLSSPLTVTLGDEFQGVCADVQAGSEIILRMEHQLRAKPLKVDGSLSAYQLRYVLHRGEIESPINPERAHGMLGPGLTEARERLNDHRRGMPRMRISLNDETVSRRLNDLFAVLDAISEDYNPDDFEFITALMEEKDSSLVGERFNRHRTSVDRRRRTLRIDAYLTLERLILDVAS